MRNGDTPIDKEGGETREGEEPGEDGASAGCQVNEGQASHEELEQCDSERTTLLVNVSHELGSHAILAKRLECSSRGKGTRISDTHDGDQDHGVEDRGKCLDACKFDSDDEGGATTGAQAQERGVGGHNKTDEEEIDDVEDADTPDYLTSRFGNRPLGVLGFRSSQSSEFGSTKGKRCCDEHGTESLKAVNESSGIVPISGSEVASRSGGRYTTTVDDDSKDHEANAGNNLHDTENEFDLARHWSGFDYYFQSWNRSSPTSP